MVRKIVCPNCTGIFEVSNQTGATAMEVTCPQCAARLRVKFLAVQQQPNFDDQETQLDIPPIPQVKRFRLNVGGTTYNLQSGQNTIGRMATSSEASLQIATDSRKMSRMHARIVVYQTEDSHAVLSNWHNKNTTAVNDVAVNESDNIVLHPGDKITMGDVNMTFEAY